MPSDRLSRLLTTSLAGSATVATFAKSFTPFYLIGSTAIFVAACLIGLVLLALSWRQILDAAGHVRVILAAMALVYAIVIASYFASSFHQVPLTHLLGILIFHAMFLLFGLASAGALTSVFNPAGARCGLFHHFRTIRASVWRLRAGRFPSERVRTWP